MDRKTPRHNKTASHCDLVGDVLTVMSWTGFRYLRCLKLVEHAVGFSGSMIKMEVLHGSTIKKQYHFFIRIRIWGHLPRSSKKIGLEYLYEMAIYTIYTI